MTNASSKFITKSSELLHMSEKNFSKLALSGICGIYFFKIIYPKLLSLRKQQKNNVGSDRKSKNPRSKTPAVNKEFWDQLWKLLKIIIPGAWSKSAMILFFHTLSLVARTFLSIYVAKLEGKIVKSIVSKDLFRFAMMMTKWITIAIPATFINSSIRFLESHLALSFRTKLVQYFYNLYFKRQCYYRVSNLDGRMENADHCLTDDISAFSSSIAHLYSHITKPILDSLLITYSLASLAKARGGASIPGETHRCEAP